MEPNFEDEFNSTSLTAQDRDIISKDVNKLDKPIHATPKPKQEIGIDTDDVIFQKIVGNGEVSTLDLAKIESFTQVAQNRNQFYDLFDTMANDTMVSAVLETYAEDITEYNDQGKIVWAESTDADTQKAVNYILDSVNVDKHIYSWAYSLCKYGDVYLRLFRESDVQDDLIFNKKDKRNLNEDIVTSESDALNEGVKIIAHSRNDHYVDYVELESNPAELFELTKLGKTCGYIKAPLNLTSMNQDLRQVSNMFTYSFRQDDVELHSATDYVHGMLDGNKNRTKEEVKIFTSDSEDSQFSSYSVAKGLPLLYNLFKVWRQMTLLENSILLNRLTKSSIVRIIGVQVGDMDKNTVKLHLQNIKSLIEQKGALDTGNSYNEYTNPGPVENNIYVPIHGETGQITTSEIGGDVDVKSLADLEYYRDKFFGGTRTPKQYFGFTDDAAGFSGGESLAQLSSRYAKAIKRIQNVLCQMITDLVNLRLIDKGLSSYINKFTIRMLAPTTQEEVSRRENLVNKVASIRDIMDLIETVETPSAKMTVLRNLISTLALDAGIEEVLDNEIEKLIQQEEEEGGSNDNPESNEEDIDFGSDSDFGFEDEISSDEMADSDLFGASGDEETAVEDEVSIDDSEELPAADELGIDFSDNEEF